MYSKQIDQEEISFSGSVLVSDKIDFKPKLIRTGREGYCILTQGKKTTKKIMQF